MMIRLGRTVAQNGVTEARLWKIAKMLVSHLVCNQKQAAAVALAVGNASPLIPVFHPPETIHELLTHNILYEHPSLNFATRGADNDLV
jgi:hypothetical protein